MLKKKIIKKRCIPLNFVKFLEHLCTGITQIEIRGLMRSYSSIPISCQIYEYKFFVEIIHSKYRKRDFKSEELRKLNIKK